MVKLTCPIGKSVQKKCGYRWVGARGKKRKNCVKGSILIGWVPDQTVGVSDVAESG